VLIDSGHERSTHSWVPKQVVHGELGRYVHVLCQRDRSAGRGRMDGQHALGQR